MGRPKKPAKELTTEEVLHRLFPRQVRDDLKNCAHERAGQGKRGSSSRPKK